MKELEIYNNYSMEQLLDKRDIIECIEDAERSLRIGKMLNKQAEVYGALVIEAPTVLCQSENLDYKVELNI